jgi:hypothetical protein
MMGVPARVNQGWWGMDRGTRYTGDDAHRSLINPGAEVPISQSPAQLDLAVQAKFA